MIRRLQSAISLFTCCCIVCMASPTSSSIGMVMTTGNVLVDGSQVPGSSAIFSGSRISAGDRSSNIQFSDGTSALTRPGAIMTVYREHSVLQHGVAIQRGIDKHPVTAGDLGVSGATPGAVALIGVQDALHYEVAAQQGESEVRTPSGDLVARVEPGQILSFTLQATSESQEKSAQICGDLDQNHQLTDVTTNVTYQLQGPGLDQYVGKTVRVNGTAQSAATGAGQQLFTVSSLKKVNHSCEGAVVHKGLIVFLIFVAAGAALIGVDASGGFGPSPSPVTPAVP